MIPGIEADPGVPEDYLLGAEEAEDVPEGGGPDSYLTRDTQALLDRKGVPRAVPGEYDPPDPSSPGNLCYPDYDKKTTRVVSYPAVGPQMYTEEAAWLELKKKYATPAVVEKCHTATRWAWRVRGEPYRECRDLASRQLPVS